MYIPNDFAETDTEKLFDFIQANSFGILFSQRNGQPYATHLPFLVEREAKTLKLLPDQNAREISDLMQSNLRKRIRHKA
jgi:predicted FMN-binding regulatory protein PaiB